MMFNILKNYHVMIAIPIIENHQAVFPPIMAPVPKVPHVAGAALCLGPWGALTGKPNPTEFSASGGIMMSQGTDIGPLIPHYNLIPPAPPNSLLPILILTSGSKSHFGAHNSVLPQGPVAFAVAVVVNFNLNCAGPAWPPLPSGLVITFNTHMTGATLGDILAGALHLLVDMGIQFILNRIFASARVTNFMENIAQRALGPGLRALGYGNVAALVEYGIPGLGRFGKNVGSAAEEFLFAIPGTLVALGVGSPLGYSPEHSPVGGYGGKAEDAGHGAAQRAVDNYNNSPGPADYPAPAGSTPPGSGGTPPPAGGSSSPPGDYPVPGQGGVPDDGSRSA